MKPKGQSRKSEVDALARRSLQTAQFLAVRDRIELDNWRVIIAGTAAHGRLTPMRLLADELSHMAKLMLSPDEQRVLAKELRETLGADLDAEARTVTERIKAIQARGKIRTDTEYRLVRGRVEELEADPSQSQDVQRLVEMLNHYEI
jgi:hypothetical protein